MKKQPTNREEGPPVFRSWGMFYAAVIAWLVLLILLFSLFTKHFS